MRVDNDRRDAASKSLNHSGGMSELDCDLEFSMALFYATPGTQPNETAFAKTRDDLSATTPNCVLQSWRAVL